MLSLYELIVGNVDEVIDIHAQLEDDRAELALMATQEASASEAKLSRIHTGEHPHLSPMERGGLRGPLRIAVRSELPVRSSYYTRSWHFSNFLGATRHGCGHCMHLRWNDHGLVANTVAESGTVVEQCLTQLGIRTPS